MNVAISKTVYDAFFLQIILMIAQYFIDVLA